MEWILHPEVVTLIFKLWVSPQWTCSPQSTTLEQLSQFISPIPEHISNSRAPSTGGGCCIKTLAVTANVHIFFISLAEQCHSESLSHAYQQVILIVPWWLSQPWFPHLIQLSVSPVPSRHAGRLNQITPKTGNLTICTYGGSHAALTSSRIFRRGL